MKFHTIGYGGRSPQDFLSLLKAHSIAKVVDVRLRPDRSSMGIYAQAKDPTKGIQGLLASAGIQYRWIQELGNLFVSLDDWAGRYRRLVDQSGGLLVERLLHVPEPLCLMCAEKHASECHRKIIADWLVARGYQVEHIE